jgi:hypothetical protein
MSPIGRVFIVLNVILAGAFVGFSGTFLQRQHAYKTMLEAEKDAHKKDNEAMASKIAKAEGDYATASLEKSKVEQERDQLKNDRDARVDEIKQQAARLASYDADLKKLMSAAEATSTVCNAALDKAQQAFKQANDDEKTRDDAVRAKEAAEAENRKMNSDIAELNTKVTDKDLAIAGLTKDKNELGLLVDVAKAKGFLPQMAVPALAGTVSNVSDRLVTLSITSNPTNAEVKAGYRFAIYDASGYKGEARVTDYDAGAKAAFCTMEFVKGVVKTGDSASTQLAGTH